LQKFARQLGCEANSESVMQALRKEKSLKVNHLIPYINKVRKLLVKIVNNRVVGVNPKYSTKAAETPTYLSGVSPSGGAFSFDILTTTPKHTFLATTDPRRDPSTVPSDLVNLLVHEEYGHCVHYSNSSRGYGAKPALVEMLNSILGSAISEGMSFQFFTKAWRMTRFLRVIGDARINSRKQDLPDFVEWASKETGLSKSMIYFQVFPAHQGIGPGYASTYAIIGESIRKIQNAAKEKDKDLVKLNTTLHRSDLDQERYSEHVS